MRSREYCDAGSAGASPSRKTAKAEAQKIFGVLHSWGIDTLGQFAALPKDDVAKRLGPEAVCMWERASGKSRRLLKLIQPRETFHQTFEFEHEVETSEPLLFMLRRFLEQLQRRLSAQYHVAKELTLTISFTNKSAYERHFEIPQPTTDVNVLFRMLETHLETFTSEHPIVAVQLKAIPARPGRQQFGLFDTTLRDPTQLHETLTRLTGLLGADRVGTPVVEATHRPDAFGMRPFEWKLPEHRDEAVPMPRCAFRRFRFDQPANVLLENEKPAHLQSGEIRGDVSQAAGPYALSGNWWDEHHWARAEWDVDLNGRAVIRCHQNQNGWVLDGVYD